MSIWKAVVTEKGDALLAKMTQGKTLEITHAEVGSGKIDLPPDDLTLLKQQTSVSNVKGTATIEPVGYPEVGMCALPVTLTNEGITASYDAWQIGVFANDPDEGKVLFFIAQAEDKATTIPSTAQMPSYKSQVIFSVEYGMADSVNVSVNPANAVSQAGMENYVAAQLDGLTPEDLGLGSVNNTPDIDKHVAYAQRAGSADKTQYALTIHLNGGRTESTDQWTFDGSTSRDVNITPEKIGLVKLEDLPYLHIWKTYEAGPDEVCEKEITGVDNTIISMNGSAVQYANSINTDGGTISMAGPSNVEDPTASELEVIKGKYIHSTWNDSYYFVPSDASIGNRSSQVGGNTMVYATPLRKIYIGGERVGFGVSMNRNEYPNSGKHTDGLWYEYHKQLGE